MKKFLLFIFSLFSMMQLSASHIAGGEMTYTYNPGLNRYNISLVIYRDDFNGNPNAGYDSPAIIVVYDQFGNFVQTLQANFNPSQVINNIGLGPGEFPPCAALPNNIRIQKYTYTVPFTPPNPNIGYYFVYARCCRNGNLINNLVNPGDQGGKYVAYAPPTAQFQNNSPTFVNNPKVFFCLNAPLNFDQSATDVDGDQLVYSLCAPYQGLTTNNPILQPGDPIPGNFGPPFQFVTWAGGYSATTPLGAASGLTIDPQTGVLTGTPTQQGTFVVGICVEEYRNGVLLSTILRDFQYTVIPCDFPTPAAQNIGQNYTGVDPNTGQNRTARIIERNCENFTVNFVNQSAAPAGVPFNQLTFTWEFGDGNTSNAVNPIHTYPDTGAYLVKLKVETPTGVANDCGADSTYYWVLIYPDYTADFTFAPQSVCIGQQVNFTNTSFSNYDIPVQWRWTLGDGTVRTTENVNHSYSSAGTFNVQLRVTTQKGCVKTVTKPVVVNPTPVASFPAVGPVCVGQPVQFTNASTISSGTITSFSWNLGAGVNSTQQNPTNTYTTAGTYSISLTVTSNQGCTNTFTRSLIVNPLPNISLTPNSIICPNSSIQLNASGGAQYSWTPATLLNNPNISNPVATLGLDPTTFKVVVTTAQGCVDSASTFIDLFPLPLADAGEDTSVCLNVSDLTVFNTTVPLSASGGIAYQWSPTTGLSNPNSANTNATPQTNTTYTVLVTDANGCIATDTVRVTVLNPALDLIQVDVDSTCFGDTVFVSVLDQGPVSTYVWTPATFVTDANANAPGFFPPVNTVYTLAISNYCYQDQDDVLIEVLPLPNLDAGPLDSICIGDPPYQLNATPNNLAYYEWTSADNSISNPNIPNPTVSPTVTSDYYLYAIDSIGTLGCINTDSVKIIVYQLPDIAIGLPVGYPGWICLGDNIALEAITFDGILFEWSNNGVATFNATNTQTTIATPIDTTLFTVVTTNIHGCVNSDSVVIDVQLPIIPFVGGDSTMCFGEYVDLFAGGGLYYQWEPAEIFSNPTYFITQAYPSESIEVSVNISNDCFDSTAYKFITVYQLPLADAGDDLFIFRDESDFLNGSGTGAPLWYTSANTFDGILDFPSTFGPEVSPFNTTTYILQITDEVTGCRNYDTAVVNVEVLTILAFPTGFTPNGDGVNDFARIIKYLNIDRLIDLSIYNRFGEAVFRTNNINEGWDGTYKGKDSEIGTYIWVIRAVTKDNEEILRKGNITLIR